MTSELDSKNVQSR